jgi:hypothetical protein
MKMTLVPNGHVAQLIPALWPYLSKSEEWTHGRATVDDILRFILTGQMQLWVGHEDNEIYGHVITEVKAYPRCKMLVIQYCAGEANHMQYVEDQMYDLLDRFAKDAGCAGIEFVGRPGWRKSAGSHGYTVQSVTYQKFFKGAENGPAT